MIKEVATALSMSHPLLKVIEKDGSLSTSYLQNKFYRENLNIIEPIEYMLNERENKSFQYVPLLKRLQQLFNRKNVVDKVVENHRAHQSHGIIGEQRTYKSFQDGSHFKENGFLSGGEFRILLTMYIDDFEVRNSLGTSRNISSLVSTGLWVICLQAHIQH